MQGVRRTVAWHGQPQINTRLNRELFHYINDLARLKNTTPSAFLRSLIESYRRDNPLPTISVPLPATNATKPMRQNTGMNEPIATLQALDKARIDSREKGIRIRD